MWYVSSLITEVKHKIIQLHACAEAARHWRYREVNE
jgi:hypothetical protein